MFGRVGPVFPLPQAGLAHGVRIAPDIEARELDQRDPVVEIRIWRSAEHLDVVTEVDQRLAEVADVHALATDMLLAAIGEERNTQSFLINLRIGHEHTRLPRGKGDVK